MTTGTGMRTGGDPHVSLADVRITVADGVPGAAARLRAAGAMLADAAAAVRIVPAAPAAYVGVTPTAGTSCAHLTVVAPDLEIANRVSAVLVADPPARPKWPADVRLAAPAQSVIGVTKPALTAVSAALSGTATQIRTLDSDPGATIPDGLNAVLTPAIDAVVGDRCAVTVSVSGMAVTVWARRFDDAVAFDIAASLSGSRRVEHVWPLQGCGPVELVVFGAHLLGGPLTHQLTDLGARWAGELTTAPHYRMTVLPSVPAKPAITRVADGGAGAALYGQRWLMSAAALGRFLTALPQPMQLGKVEFGDGTWRTAFGCDGAAAGGTDISAYGSWPAAVAAGAVDGAG